jgi:ribosomal protein L11 methyltransferase
MSPKTLPPQKLKGLRRKPLRSGSWSLSKRISPAMGEVLLELFHQAYGGSARSTEMISSQGIVLDQIFDAPPPTKSNWKRKKLKELDVGQNNRLAKSLAVGRTWLVIPPGKATPRTRRRVLVMEAGMGFGSGSHETTQLCLELLERQGSQGSLLDVGTGSGILAVAASLQGFRRVVGMELDPKALRSARVNAALQLRKVRIEWRRGDLAKWNPRATFDVITANLLSGLLIDNARRLVRWLKPRGKLIVSGLLWKERGEVERAFGKVGLAMRQSKKRGKWGALLLRK